MNGSATPSIGASEPTLDNPVPLTWLRLVSPYPARLNPDEPFGHGRGTASW